MQDDHNPRPLISIIIPVYNLEDYVEHAVMSALAQTYENIEIIAVNDGSKDHTGEILMRLAEEYPIIKYVYQENQGLDITRQTGVKASSGEYIMFLDADDTMEPDTARLLLDKAIEGGYDIVRCNHRRLSLRYRTVMKEKITGTLTGEQFLVATICHNISVTAWGKLYRASMFEGVEHFEVLRLGQDSFTNMQIGMKRPKVGFIDYCGWNYLIRRNSAVRTKRGLEYFEVFSGHVEYIFRKNPDKLERPPEYYYMMNNVRTYLTYVLKLSNRWAGSTDYARRIHKFHAANAKELRKYFPAVRLFVLRLDRWAGMRWLIRIISRFMKFKLSLVRMLNSN